MKFPAVANVKYEKAINVSPKAEQNSDYCLQAAVAEQHMKTSNGGYYSSSCGGGGCGRNQWSPSMGIVSTLRKHARTVGKISCPLLFT